MKEKEKGLVRYKRKGKRGIVKNFGPEVYRCPHQYTATPKANNHT